MTGGVAADEESFEKNWQPRQEMLQECAWTFRRLPPAVRSSWLAGTCFIESVGARHFREPVRFLSTLQWQEVAERHAIESWLKIDLVCHEIRFRNGDGIILVSLQLQGAWCSLADRCARDDNGCAGRIGLDFNRLVTAVDDR